MTGDARQGTVQRVGQVIALAGVAALLALLVWKVAFGNEDGAADELARGKVVEAPAFDLDRLDQDGTLSIAELRGQARRRQLLGLVVHPVPRRGARPRADLPALP